VRKQKNRERSIHHRKPRSIGGGNNTDNLIDVPVTKHRAWHTLFENLTAVFICRLINDVWLDTDYKFVCVPREDHAEATVYARTLRKKRGK